MQTTINDPQVISNLMAICRHQGLSESDLAKAHLDKGPLFFHLTNRGLIISPTEDLKALFDYDLDEDDVIWDPADEQDLIWPKSL